LEEGTTEKGRGGKERRREGREGRTIGMGLCACSDNFFFKNATALFTDNTSIP